ncbi:hypothetical protein [Herbiconiux sp. YIM B11900]|uniref:hypothetical protein n=1 Tax=Herbiconiux sp. YIM B11900 TaxID=3404131 RepID=UPI003F851DFE
MASNVDYTIEIPGVYDGWSIAVIAAPVYAYVNRWASDDDPLVPEPGYERRFAATEEYIERSKIARGLRRDVVWA